MSMRIDDNLVIHNGRVRCAHCDYVLAEPGERTLERALTRRGDVTKAGPQVRANVPRFVSVAVEFRQRLCPGCHTALLTEVAAVGDPETRDSLLTRTRD